MSKKSLTARIASAILAAIVHDLSLDRCTPDQVPLIALIADLDAWVSSPQCGLSIFVGLRGIGAEAAKSLISE
jgi:hypothetical protein